MSKFRGYNKIIILTNVVKILITFEVYLYK
jgi:hypothetical protein